MGKFFAGLVVALLLGCGTSDRLEEVRELHEAGLYEQSLEPLRELLKTRSDDPEVHYLYGIALLRAEGPSRAQFPLQRAMEDSAWVVRAGITLASGAIATQNPDTAIQVLARVLEAEPDNVRALVMRTNAYVATRRHYEDALVDANRVIELDPDNLTILPFRVVALLGLQRIGEAGHAIEEMERRHKEEGLEVGDTSRYCATRAIFALEKGDEQAADRIFRECLEQFPASASLVDAAMQFYEGQRRPARSIEVLAAALEASGGDRAFRVPLVVRLHASNRKDEARKLLEDATGSPKPVVAATAWVDLAGYLIDDQHYDEGIEAFQKGLEEAPEVSPQLLFQYADALLMSERYDEALEAAQKNTVPAYRALTEGRVLLAQGKPAEALERFAEGIKEWPNHAVARYYAAFAAESAGQIDRAIEEYRYTIRASSSGTDAHIRLARIHLAENKPEFALTALHHDVAAHAGDLNTALIELETLSQLDRTTPLPQRLRTVIEPDPVWGRALAALSAGARARGGPEAALAIIEGADRLDLKAATSAPALESLVVDLVALGRADEAVERASESAEAEPESAAFQAIHGLALAASGNDPSGARAAYERALALDPENPVALAGIARILLQGGKTEEAIPLFERASAAAPEDSRYKRAIAEQLARSGKNREAEAKLTELLSEQATDAEAALLLARLREERGAERATTRALAARAVRFGGGEEASRFLERLGDSNP